MKSWSACLFWPNSRKFVLDLPSSLGALSLTRISFWEGFLEVAYFLAHGNYIPEMKPWTAINVVCLSQHVEILLLIYNDVAFQTTKRCSRCSQSHQSVLFIFLLRSRPYWNGIECTGVSTDMTLTLLWTQALGNIFALFLSVTALKTLF